MVVKIQPALTPDEWEPARHVITVNSRVARCVSLQMQSLGPGGDVVVSDSLATTSPNLSVHISDLSDKHALAALALHGHPFGFTREHVELLTEAALDARGEEEKHGGTDLDGVAAPFEELAARIEALLPPE